MDSESPDTMAADGTQSGQMLSHEDRAGSDGEQGLSPEDEELAHLLAHGLTQEAAGEAAGVSSRTVRRRLNDPEFKARVTALRREGLNATTGRLVRLADSAVDALEELLASDNPSLRFRAAQTVLAMGRRNYREDTIETDFVARLEEVEGLLNGIEGMLHEP